MDPSYELASAGEFSGSESGWTTYIGSPIHNGTYDDDDEEQSVDMEDYGNKYKNVHDDKGENNDENDGDVDYEESDDSMASDASSGPSHLQLVCVNSEGSHHHGLDFTKHVENDHEKILSAKRVTKQARKTKHVGMVEREEYSAVAADSAASHV